MDGARLTGGAIDRLGDRLRAAQVVVAEDDLETLQSLRREFDETLAVARERVVSAVSDAKPTTRIKTVQTLVDKLRRESSMKLSRVQDIAGMRIVRDMSLAEQDQLVESLIPLFEDARVVDRRVKPSFGYRAVHLIVRCDGRLVEIQVRTGLQDRWAQIVERMADHWGRTIRYGDAPEEPDALVSEYTRSDVVALARRLSPLIEQCERSPGTHGRRIQVSTDAFCTGVVDVLSMFGRLNITSEAAWRSS